MTDPRLLLSDIRLEEIERDAAHSRRLGLTVTFAVVSEQLAFVQELRRLREELAEARHALGELGRELRTSGSSQSSIARASDRPHSPVAHRSPRHEPAYAPDREPSYPPTRREPPLEVEVTIVQRDVTGRELSRVRQRMPVDDVQQERRGF